MSSHNKRRSPTLRQIVFLGGLVLLLGAASAYIWIQGPLDQAVSLERQLAKNTGRIMTLDEILTMSARMAAAAHDPGYEARYNNHVDELDALIKSTLALVPDEEVAKAVSATDAANLRLVDMETRSFALDKQRKHAEALALLEGERYRADKAVYAGGMGKAFARMDAIVSAQRASVTRWALALQVAAVLALSLVVAVWLLEQRDQRRRTMAHAVELEATVAARTVELAQRNRGMRLVLDNVAQGFLTIGLDGAMAADRSAILERWFGAPPPGATLSGYLRALAPDFAAWLDLGLGELRDGFLPAELALAQLPQRFIAGAQTFDVGYSVIGNDQVDSLLVIISDVTANLVRERIEREQRDLVSLFARISIDRTGVEEFLAEAAGLVDALRKETDPVIQKRVIHTLKGNCAIYGLQSYADVAHRIESELADSGGALDRPQCDELVGLWKEAMARVAPLLGVERREIVEIEHHEIEAALASASHAPRALREVLASWMREPLARRFERLSRQITSLSRGMGRPDPVIRTTGERLRLEHDAWQQFWATMVHVVRNAVDHGIESPDERRHAGKPDAGVIDLGAEHEHGKLVISVRDDGRGIDWARISAKAAERGIPCSTHVQLVEALFADGVTSRDTVGELSGRGVGLAALRQVVHCLGGTIDVESTPEHGTTFRFSFDDQTTATASQAPRLVRTSLLPFPLIS